MHLCSLIIWGYTTTSLQTMCGHEGANRRRTKWNSLKRRNRSSASYSYLHGLINRLVRQEIRFYCGCLERILWVQKISSNCRFTEDVLLWCLPTRRFFQIIISLVVDVHCGIADCQIGSSRLRVYSATMHINRRGGLDNRNQTLYFRIQKEQVSI